MAFARGCLLVLLAAHPFAPAPSQGPPPGYIEIDGSKTPTAIPDWAAWQNALRVLALAANQERSLIFPESALSPEDRKLVVLAAQDQVSLDDACEQRQIAIGRRLKDVERSRMMDELRQEQLTCRTALLDAKDRLLARLSPGAALWLKRFVDESRASIKVFVHKDGLEHYRRPR